MNQITSFAILIITAIISILIGYFIIIIITARIRNKITDGVSEDQLENTEKAAKTISGFVFMILMVFNILLGFNIMGFNVGLLMGGIAFGIGFALENTLSNMIAGIMIIANKKIKIGETVEILSPVNVFGQIKEIKIRYTIIKDFSKRKVIIPNTKIISSPIKTYKSEEIIRNIIELEVSFDTDLQSVKKLIIDTINAHPKTILNNQTNVLVVGYSENGILINGITYCNPKLSSPYSFKSDLNIAINKAFNVNNINVPYTHTIIDTSELSPTQKSSLQNLYVPH